MILPAFGRPGAAGLAPGPGACYHRQRRTVGLI